MITNTPTNEDRAGWAMAAVETFAERTRMQGEDLETQLIDLLADVMHLCQLNKIDFNQVMRMGGVHFNDEAGE